MNDNIVALLETFVTIINLSIQSSVMPEQTKYSILISSMTKQFLTTGVYGDKSLQSIADRNDSSNEFRKMLCNRILSEIILEKGVQYQESCAIQFFFYVDSEKALNLMMVCIYFIEREAAYILTLNIKNLQWRQSIKEVHAQPIENYYGNEIRFRIV